MNNRLQIDPDVFYYKYRDYQVDQLEDLPVPGGGYSFGDDIFNAGRATSYGGELETRWLITNSDEVDLNVAGLHARFDEFLFPLQAAPPRHGVPNPVTYVDLAGQVPTSAPKWTATLSWQHTWRFHGGSSIDWMVMSHVESSYWLAVDHVVDPNKAGSYQGGYSRSQTAVTYFTPDKKFSVQAFVRNIENKAVMNTFSYGGAPPAYASISPPRTFGVAVMAHW